MAMGVSVPTVTRREIQRLVRRMLRHDATLSDIERRGLYYVLLLADSEMVAEAICYRLSRSEAEARKFLQSVAT